MHHICRVRHEIMTTQTSKVTKARKHMHKEKNNREIQRKYNKKNTIDINITQMMVGKQWVKS